MLRVKICPLGQTKIVFNDFSNLFPSPKREASESTVFLLQRSHNTHKLIYIRLI